MSHGEQDGPAIGSAGRGQARTRAVDPLGERARCRGAASPDRAAGLAGTGELGDRGAGWGVTSDGESVAVSLRRVRDGWVGRRPAAGAASIGGPGEDRRGHPDPAAEESGGDALVESAAGTAAGGRPRDGRGGVEGVRVKPWKAETFKFSTDPQNRTVVRAGVGSGWLGKTDQRSSTIATALPGTDAPNWRGTRHDSTSIEKIP